jgi:hypothetical protein
MSTQCSEWLASMLEILLGFLEDQDFIKSFREGSKVLIAWRGGNQAGRFLEAAAFGMGGRKGFSLIPKGRGGWGWRKILRRAKNGHRIPLCHGGLRFGFLVCKRWEG